MPNTCIIRRGGDRRVSSVSTPFGGRSVLYDAIASIPVIENRERALNLFKKVFSRDFKKRFGNWVKRKPINPAAYKSIEKNISIIPSENRNAVLQKAREMSNPVFVKSDNSTLGTTWGSTYSTDVKAGDEILLVDMPSTHSILNLSDDMKPETLSESEYESLMLSMQSPISMEYTDYNGNKHLILNNRLMKYKPSDLTEESVSDEGFYYENGEPKLFFQTDDGTLYETYGEAIRSGESTKVGVGFVAGPLAGIQSAVSSEYDFPVPRGYSMSDANSFIPIASIYTSVDERTRQGLINRLIKQGYLSGSRIYDPETNNYYLTGEGTGSYRIFNAATAYMEILNRRPSRDVSMTEEGYITFRSRDNNVVEATTTGGNSVRLDKNEILQAVRQGRYDELANRYHFFDELVLSLILETTAPSSQSADRLRRSLTEEENARKEEVLGILRNLGLSVIGMSDYISKYGMKNGTEPSAKALADIANGVIALSEDATWEDVEEEVAHFLVESYTDQDAVNEALEGIESTEEWATWSDTYYRVYGELLQGEELETAVRREILGKMLKSRLGDRSRREDVATASDTSFLGRLRNLGRRIITFITFRNEGARNAINKVLDDIANSAHSDLSQFDTNLLQDIPFTLYSVSNMNNNRFMKSRIAELKKTLFKLRQISTGRDVGSAYMQNLVDIERKINETEKELTRDESIKTLTNLVYTAEAQVRYLKQIMKTSKGKSIDPSDQMNIRIVNEEILPLMTSLRGYVKSNMRFVSEDNFNMSGFKSDMMKRIDGIIGEINSIQSDFQADFERNIDSTIDNLLEKWNIPMAHRNRVKKLFFAVQEACGFLSRWFGILEHSNNVINNALGMLISRNNYNAMRETESDVKDFLQKVQREGWKQSDYERLIQKYDGKFSKYLLSPLNLAKFEHDYKVQQMKAFREVIPEMKDITDEYIEELVNNDKHHTFERDVKESDGTVKKRKLRVKPSVNRVNLDILTAEQEAKYSEIMRKWSLENEEQPYLDGYTSFTEKIFDALKDREIRLNEKETVKGISDTTKEFLNNIRRQRYMLRQPFMENGKLRDDYYISSAYESEASLNKMYKDAMNDYYYINGERYQKTGPDHRFSLELQAFEEEKRKFYEEERKARGDDSGNSRVTGDFMETLRRVQNENGNSAAWKLITRGGHLAFSDAYWEETGFKAATTSAGNNKTKYDKIFDAIDNNTYLDENERIRLLDCVHRINENKRIIRDIISNNRSTDNPGDIAVDSMTEAEKEAVKKATDKIENDIATLFNRAKSANVNVDDFMDFSTETEVEANDAYYNDLSRSTGNRTQYDFCIQNMSEMKKRKCDVFKRKMEAAKRIGKTRFDQAEIAELKEFFDQFGPAKFVDMPTTTTSEINDFSNVVAKYINENLTDSMVKRIYTGFAKKRILPYYKRYAPDGYSLLFLMANEGTLDVVKFIEDLRNGTKSQKYPVDLKYLSFEPNRNWTEDGGRIDAGRNPLYNPNSGYGYHIPKMSKYRNDEYFNHFGIDPENPSGEATQNKEDFEMLGMMKRMNEQSFAKYGLNNRNVYVIPQISTQDIERMANVTRGFGSVIKNFVSDIVMDRVDDSIYGRADNTENIDVEDRVRVMPKYYTYDLENQNDLSHDLGYSFSMLVSQANLYREKSESLKDVMSLEMLMLNSQFNNGKVPESTQAYAMFKDFMNEHFYGIRMNMKKKTMYIGGYEVDVTKLVWNVNKFLNMMNLALSPFVAATGGITGQINFLIEGFAGQYISRDSISYAYKEISRNMPSYISEIGDIDRRSKLYVVGEYLGLFNFRNRVRGTGYSRIARVLTRDCMYKLMEISNSPLDPQVMVAVLDGVRYYDTVLYAPNGTILVDKGFYTKKELEETLKEHEALPADFDEVWSNMRSRSLWNSIDVKDGLLTAAGNTDISEDVILNEVLRRRPQVRSLAQIIDGSLNEENRVAATRNWLGNFTTAHRGWMFLTAQRLWKKRGYNFQTMQEEEGLVVTIKNTLKDIKNLISEKGKGDIVMAVNKYWNDLDPTQKQNLMRLGVYSATYLILNVLALGLFALGDDDDDTESWIAQFTAYVGMRTVNEIASQMPGIFEFNIIDAVEDPFVTARKVGDLLNFRNYSLDKVTSGTYEGESKLFRQIAKQTFIKQWYNIKTPDAIKDSFDWWLQTNNKSMMFFYGANKMMEPKEEE